MEITGFLIRIIFIALPGIIGSRLYRKFCSRPVRKDWEDYSDIILFSLLSYVILGIVSPVFNLALSRTVEIPLQALFDETLPLRWTEISGASMAAVMLAFIGGALHRRKVIHNIGRLLHATNRFGEEDVWDYFHNLPDVPWVIVRDHKLDLTYYGWIQAFSESEKERELLIREVEVYSNVDADKTDADALMYTRPMLYVARKREDLTLEVP